MTPQPHRVKTEGGGRRLAARTPMVRRQYLEGGGGGIGLPRAGRAALMEQPWLVLGGRRASGGWVATECCSAEGRERRRSVGSPQWLPFFSGSQRSPPGAPGRLAWAVHATGRLLRSGGRWPVPPGASAVSSGAGAPLRSQSDLCPSCGRDSPTRRCCPDAQRPATGGAPPRPVPDTAASNAP